MNIIGPDCLNIIMEYKKSFDFIIKQKKDIINLINNLIMSGTAECYFQFSICTVTILRNILMAVNTKGEFKVFIYTKTVD